MSRTHLIVIFVVITVAAACLVAPPSQAQSVNEPALLVQPVASGLAQPTTMAFIGPNDILVLQKADGNVRRITGGVLQAAPVLDVAVDSNSERGLLGIAVDPDFAVTRHVYLSYTESSTGADTNGVTPLGNRIYRYDWSGSALVNPLLVFDLPATPGPNHDGGVIAFGPDGFLYGVIGDLNRSGKLQNIASGADPDDTGVIWRIDAITGFGAADNPFVTPAEPAPRMNRYYAYGVRNSFGLTFDPATGRLWDTENGPNNYDEVNRIVSGFNSGWNRLMGPASRDAQGTSDLWVAPGSSYRDPDFSWNATVAPTALVFPASPLLGCTLKDQLVVGDNNCGQLYRFTLDAARNTLTFTSPPLLDRVADNLGNRCADEMTEILFGGSFGAVTDLEIGPDGWLYVVSLTLGQVLRIGPRVGFFPDGDGDGVNDACDCAALDPFAYAAPGAIARMRVQGTSPFPIFWDSVAGVTGPGTTTTIVSGLASHLRRDAGYAAACDLAAGAPGTSFVDPRPDPATGQAYYYLVRAQNSCGAGTFGDGTPVPDPRDVLDSGTRPPCGG